jgi:hypothetical protein
MPQSHACLSQRPLIVNIIHLILANPVRKVKRIYLPHFIEEACGIVTYKEIYKKLQMYPGIVSYKEIYKMLQMYPKGPKDHLSSC